MKNERESVLPMEVQQQALWERIGKEYPLLYTDQFLLLDTRTTRLGIDDITYRAKEPIREELDILALSCRGWFEIYDVRSLMTPFVEKVRRLLNTMNRKRCVVIFPGNGAEVVKDLLPPDITEEVTVLELPTQRKFGIKGILEGVTISDVTKARKVIVDTKVESIVVLDDVIVTGATLTAIRGNIPGRGIAWYAGSLLMRSPLQGKKTIIRSGVEGYDATITPIVYQGTTGTPAVNSLSTLTGNSEKSIAVRAKYMVDYVENKEAFLKTIQILQNKCLAR